MIVRPGDRCECRFLNGVTKECTVLRGPLPPANGGSHVHPNMTTTPYRYEVRFDDGSVEIVGEPRLTRIGARPDDSSDRTG